MPSAPHFDVRGLQIAMDDALLVRGFERLGNLLRDRQRLLDRESRRARCAADRSSPSTSSITSAVMPAHLFEPVDGGDVRMIQRGEDFGFALKTREPIVVSGERWRQDLDRDLTLQLGVGGPIHLPHPAFADLGGDFVDAEAGAGGEGQVADYMGLDGLGRDSAPYRPQCLLAVGQLPRLDTEGFCVTVSVAVGTPRDGQDATGRESIIEPYLAERADFTKQ